MKNIANGKSLDLEDWPVQPADNKQKVTNIASPLKFSDLTEVLVLFAVTQPLKTLQKRSGKREMKNIANGKSLDLEDWPVQPADNKQKVTNIASPLKFSDLTEVLVLFAVTQPLKTLQKRSGKREMKNIVNGKSLDLEDWPVQPADNKQKVTNIASPLNSEDGRKC
jgi:hypothetical protein